MNKKAEMKEKKPTLTQRMDSMEVAREKDSKRQDKILELVRKLTDDARKEDKSEEPKKKEPDRDEQGNIIKYFKFVSPNTELLQMTSKRGRKHIEGDSYTIEAPEICGFGRDTDGPPGFYKTPDEAQAMRLREVLAELTSKKLPHVFTEVTDDEAFADF